MVVSKGSSVIRAFIAITVSNSVLEHCQRISRHLRELKMDGRFLRPESIHLTLNFLGNIDSEVVSEVVEILKSTACETASFDLQFKGVGVFPHLTRPRIVWLGIEKCEVLCEMQAKIESRLQQMGFLHNKRSFRPHLTLVRVKSRKNLSKLVRYVQTVGLNERAGQIRVRDIHLYQSILKPQGAKYRKLQTAELS